MRLSSHFTPVYLTPLVFFFSVMLFISACGDGSDIESLLTRFEGSIVDLGGAPVADATVFIFDTNEAAVVDENGSFTLESFRHLTSARFYVFSQAYSNTVEIESIPDNAHTVHITFRLDSDSNTLEILAVTFDTSEPPQNSGSSTSMEDGSNSSSGASASTSTSGGPSSQQSSGVSSVTRPTPSPTPKQGNFDSNGNTTAFGIPSGLTGNINAGRSVWGSQCAACHAREKSGRSYGQIKSSFRSIPQMQALGTNNQEIANVTAYLNRGDR